MALFNIRIGYQYQVAGTLFLCILFSCISIIIVTINIVFTLLPEPIIILHPTSSLHHTFSGRGHFGGDKVEQGADLPNGGR